MNYQDIANLISIRTFIFSAIDNLLINIKKEDVKLMQAKLKVVEAKLIGGILTMDATTQASSGDTSVRLHADDIKSLADAISSNMKQNKMRSPSPVVVVQQAAVPESDIDKLDQDYFELPDVEVAQAREKLQNITSKVNQNGLDFGFTGPKEDEDLQRVIKEATDRLNNDSYQNGEELFAKYIVSDKVVAKLTELSKDKMLYTYPSTPEEEKALAVRLNELTSDVVVEKKINEEAIAQVPKPVLLSKSVYNGEPGKVRRSRNSQPTTAVTETAEVG